MDERTLLVEQEGRKVKEDILDALDEIDTIQEEVGKISNGRKI